MPLLGNNLQSYLRSYFPFLKDSCGPPERTLVMRIFPPTCSGRGISLRSGTARLRVAAESRQRAQGVRHSQQGHCGLHHHCPAYALRTHLYFFLSHSHAGKISKIYVVFLSSFPLFFPSEFPVRAFPSSKYSSLGRYPNFPFPPKYKYNLYCPQMPNTEILHKLNTSSKLRFRWHTIPLFFKKSLSKTMVTMSKTCGTNNRQNFAMLYSRRILKKRGEPHGWDDTERMIIFGRNTSFSPLHGQKFAGISSNFKSWGKNTDPKFIRFFFATSPREVGSPQKVCLPLLYAVSASKEVGLSLCTC